MICLGERSGYGMGGIDRLELLSRDAAAAVAAPSVAHILH
jgi:hypothetical protein